MIHCFIDIRGDLYNLSNIININPDGPTDCKAWLVNGNYLSIPLPMEELCAFLTLHGDVTIQTLPQRSVKE